MLGPRLVFPLVALAVSCYAFQGITVDGVVRDRTGAVIRDATVELNAGAFHATSRSDSRGHFSFLDVPQSSGTLAVTASGFGPAQKAWTSGAGAEVHVEIALEPSSVAEQMVISATRTQVRLSDTPGSTILLAPEDIESTPALRVDDMLRQVPEFALFRRSGSRTANASAQGVSLRGLGGSATSRALVLADGISLVDPFGGWVYWDRVPRAALSDVEVFRGGASNLYGSGALAGVVQLLTREPEAPTLLLEASYGNELTPDLSLWTGTRAGPWDLSLTSELFHTDGFVLVPLSQRGSVDTRANSEDATVYTRVGHELGQNGRVFVEGNYFTESRNNGTFLQTNDTQIGEGALGIDKQLGSNDSLSGRFYGQVERFNQTFSAVALDRNSERLTDVQAVPEQVVGGNGQWTHFLFHDQTLIAGMDLNEVMGSSNELLFSGPTQARVGGGRQRNLGFFGEDIAHWRKWTAILALRFDDWDNFRGSLTNFPVAGGSVATLFSGRTETAFSPRLSLLRSINEHVSITGSVYRGFRAPTLNELYRTFRVGNVVTGNNAGLKAERLTGAEMGANVTGWDRRLDVRGNFFWSDITDPVENVTLSATPTLITRQKQNLGRTRSRGVELDGSLRVSSSVQFSAGYAYTLATVVSYPGNPGGINLVGLDVPQVPRNIFTWEARYWNPSRILLSVQGRFIGRQFDDDQNQFPLDRFYTMDFEIGRALNRSVEVFAAAENVLDQRYQVGRTPVVTVGPPILYRAGLRLNLPGSR